jgi:tRNA(fMet)-specific endonuclease VapC
MRGDANVVTAMSSHAPDDLAISSVTSYELYTGVEKCVQPERERAKVDALIGAVHCLAFDFPASQEAARIRAALEARGAIIGPYDVLIAAQARFSGLTLVTANTGEFSRVPNLTIENWQTKL